MNRNTTTRRVRVCPALLFGAALMGAALLTGCGQDIVEPLTTPEKAKAAKEGKAQAKASPTSDRPKPKSAPRRTPPARTASPAPRTPAPATPTPGGTALVDFSEPVIIEPWMMTADSGSSDTEGGWCLNKNGLLNLQNIALTSPLKELSIELKGDQAEEVWPQIDLVLYNRGRAQYFYPLKEFFVTSPTYHEHRIPFQPPLPPGTYQIALRYYNNESPGTKGDRNVHMRLLKLYPDKAPEPKVVEVPAEPQPQ